MLRKEVFGIRRSTRCHSVPVRDPIGDHLPVLEDIAMLARIRKSQEAEGFTLIELLVVMIIIGILAAIAIPVFLNQRKKAQDSAAKADVSTIGKKLANYFVDNCTVPTIGSAGGRWELTGGAPAAGAACQAPAAAIVTGTPEAD